jgi:hypothetical protein
MLSSPSIAYLSLSFKRLPLYNYLKPRESIKKIQQNQARLLFRGSQLDV